MGRITKYAPLRGLAGLLGMALLAAMGACSEGTLTPDSFDTVLNLPNNPDGRAFHAAVFMGDDVLLLGGQGSGGQPLRGPDFAERIRCASCSYVQDPAFDTVPPRVNPVALPHGTGAVVAGGQIFGVNNADLALPNFAPAFLQAATAVDGAEFVSQVGAVQPSPVGGGSGTAMVAVGSDIFLIGGRTASGVVTGDIYRLSGGVFTGPVASLATAREGHSATVLKDGTVLVVGGYGASTFPLRSAEIFDPLSLNSVLINPLVGPQSFRALHTATASRDGCRVLIFGGVDDAAGTLATTAETYQSGAQVCGGVAGRFEQVNVPAGVTVTRLYHTATLLDNGDILIVGGVDDNLGGITGAAQLFTPATEALRNSNDRLSIPRYGHTATKFLDGVLIAGGLDASHTPIAQAERYFSGF